MISEEMLKLAAAEADRAIMESLPSPAECVHEFSPEFQKKMHRIFRRSRHPLFYSLPKYAACFALLVALVSGTWLTVDAEARAEFFAWVREQYENFIEYRFIGDIENGSDTTRYELTWLPDGFALQDEQHFDGVSHLTYKDDSGDRIIFSYMEGDDAGSLFVLSDYTEPQTVRLGDIQADFYEANEETSANMLVWSSEEYVFYIMTDLSEDTMIQMANSARKK